MEDSMTLSKDRNSHGHKEFLRKLSTIWGRVLKTFRQS